MGRTYSYIKQITASKDTWRIKVKIQRLWNQTLKNQPNEIVHIDMIVVDEEGSKILIRIKKSLMDKFVNQLQEREAYIITNFNVADYIDSFKVVDHNEFVNFHKNTTVRRCTDFKDVTKPFDFVSFQDILDSKGISKIPFDVIAQVVKVGDIRDIGRDKKPFPCVLKDLQGVTLGCSLWGDFAVQLKNVVKDRNNSDLPIIILQLAKQNKYKDEVQISNCLFGSKLYINEDLEEINEFRAGILARDGGVNTSQQLTQISSHSMNSSPQDWISDLKKTPIDEIIEMTKPKDIIVVGTIRCLQSEQSWYYMSCLKCNRKVEPLEDVDFTKVSYKNTENHPYHCKEACKKFTSDVLPRFKVQIRVQDDTGSISLTLFDWDVSQLINETASHLFDKIDDPEDYELFPEELDVLINKKFVFKVEVSHYNIQKRYHVYTIRRLSDDTDVIQKVLGKEHTNQETMSEVEMEFVNDNSSQGQTLWKDVNSVTGENDVHIDLDKGSTTSPLKKRRIDVKDSDIRRIDFDEDNLPVKGSSTKMTLKVPKIEKP